jgi:hypothetical protein
MSFRFLSHLARVAAFSAAPADREEGEEDGALTRAAGLVALAAVIGCFRQQPFDL